MQLWSWHGCCFPIPVQASNFFGIAISVQTSNFFGSILKISFLQLRENLRIKFLAAGVALVAFGCFTATSANAARLPVLSVTASADDGDVAANTLDGSLATRWSAQGDGQWICYDLGSVTNVGAVKIAWYKGDQRFALFDLQTSSDDTNWITVFSGQSSGATTNFESYNTTNATGRYVRILGMGTRRICGTASPKFKSLRLRIL